MQFVEPVFITRWGWIRKHLPLTEIQQAWKFLEENLSSVSSLSSSKKETLSIDCLFYYLKYATWNNHPLFLKLFLYFLIKEFELPRKTSEELVAKFSQFFSSGKVLQKTEDQEFLRFIFITFLTAKNQHELFLELGFCQELLGSIQRATQMLQPQGKQKIYFDTTLESQFFHLIQELSQEISLNPWIIYAYKWGFLLHAIPTKWKNLNSKTGLVEFFRWFVVLGEYKDIEREHSKELLQNLLLPTGIEFPWDDFGELLQFLKQENWIFQDHYAHTKNKKDPTEYFCLTTEAYTLTSEAYSCIRLEKIALPISAEEICKLSPPWQASLLKKLDGKKYKELFFDLLLKTIPPDSLLLVCEKLKSECATETIENILRPLALNGFTLQLRDAARLALSRL